MKRKMLKTAMLFLMVVLVALPIATIAFASEVEGEKAAYFTTDEQQILEEMNPAFTTIPEVLELKKQGRLGELIAAINEEYASRYALEMRDYAEKLAGWGLEPEMTVAALADIAQSYLHENYDGIQIASVEFQNLVKEMFQGDSYPLAKMAKEDAEFGALYLYMCIYYDENINDETGKFVNNAAQPLANTTMKKTLNQVFESDFDRNFQETATMEVLHEVTKNSLTKAGPANPLNGSSIQAYAQKWANSYNTNSYVTQDSDCTNFASQCLYAGGLAMEHNNASDKTANGYVDTTARWFYFNNSSTKKYSASTSWVRVVDLYTYLSSDYAVFETSDGATMSRYLNKGFLLQGKPVIGKYRHSVIVTKNSSGALCYCAHSEPRLDEAISTFYNGFDSYRVVQTY